MYCLDLDPALGSYILIRPLSTACVINFEISFTLFLFKLNLFRIDALSILLPSTSFKQECQYIIFIFSVMDNSLYDFLVLSLTTVVNLSCLVISGAGSPAFSSELITLSIPVPLDSTI